MSSKSTWRMSNLYFSIVKIERRVIHQILSVLQDKSIGVLKIAYGHNLRSQECPLCIRKALSGAFIILYFLQIHIIIVY